MKIGILTFHRAHNYGAVLQLYALYLFLKRLGYEVYVVDFYSKAVFDNYKIINYKAILCRNPFRMLKRVLNSIQEIPTNYTKKKLYNKFIIEHFQLVNYNNINTIDTIIVGSDQVWNPKITGGFLNPYFGYGIPKNTKLLSYAASTEQTSMTNFNGIKYAKALQRFSNICVREKPFADYLNKYLEKDIHVCLDPTFLINKKDWEQFASNIPEKDYVLIYQARPNKETIKFAENIASQLGLKIIILTSNVSTINKSHIIKDNASPEEFVGYFLNAKCVIALSFHAVAFSIIAKVPFYAIKLDDGWDTRIETILNDLQLDDRFVKPNKKEIFKPINYQKIDKILLHLESKSKEYLSNLILHTL